VANGTQERGVFVWPVAAGVRSFCENEALRKLTIQRAKASLRNRARKLFGLTPADRKPFSETAADKKYQTPALRQITPEQATLLLIGHATIGDQGAKELMEVVFLARSTPRRGSAPCEPAFAPPQLYGHSPAPDCP
jgi:hypothetical protein